MSAAETTVTLPSADGSLEPYRLQDARRWNRSSRPARSRTAYAAAHVVADPLADNTPGAPARIDWDATLAFRRHLWEHGLGVADAMDTAQRGMGLGWDATAELVRRSSAEARACDGVIACGIGTDHVSADVDSLDAVLEAYLEQLEVVEAAGATGIIMASRQLVQAAQTPDDYVKVYDLLLRQVSRPVILHWLGPMFDPLLKGYWGADDIGDAMSVAIAVIADHADVVDGIKVSLLDSGHEIRMREALPSGVKMYTGDDFNYPSLIRGDANGCSHALLGVFDAIAPSAASALAALDRDDVETFDDILAPTVPLARHLFSAPTYYYKTGIVFLAWLCGHQDAFRMVGGLESARSVPHLAEVLRLADRAGLIPDPALAADRMRQFLRVAGVDS